MKLLMMEGFMGVYVRDQTTTPEVVNISNESSILYDSLFLSLRVEVENDDVGGRSEV